MPCTRAGLLVRCLWRSLIDFFTYYHAGTTQEMHWLNVPRSHCASAQKKLVLSLLYLAYGLEPWSDYRFLLLFLRSACLWQLGWCVLAVQQV